MSPRTARIVAAATCIALGLALFGAQARTPAAAQTARDLPAYRELVQSVARASWAQQPAPQPGARLAAFVELEMPPLALVGKGWDLRQRAAYAARLRAAQSRVAAEVAALGGTVLGRFSQASAGLAVAIDASSIQALSAAPGVAAVVRVGDYEASQPGTQAGLVATQAELSTLIGADEVRRLGNDGAGVEIAVVDSGVDYTHVKLGGSGSQADYRRAACGDAALTPGDARCNPGLAPPSDLFPSSKVRGGRDLVGDIWPGPDPRCGELKVCPFPDENPIDRHGHGTHVADIVAGLPVTPGGGDVGVAPGANLWAFKACNGEERLCSGLALLEAIDRAMDLDGSDRGVCKSGCLAYDPADVIVLALSFSYGQPEDAVTLFANLAGFYGSLVVAAAGNDGDKPYIVGSPATAAAALAVAESALPGTAGVAVSGGGRSLGTYGNGRHLVAQEVPPVTATPTAAEGEAIAASASRGPRIADNALKPDLAAPGAISSALAGGGSAVAPFGGSSGAAPVAAGVAALLIQELEQKGALDPAPGLADDPDRKLSLAPMLKAVLMNSARSDLRAATGGLAPLTLQGAGRVSALSAFVGRTLALDATPMVSLLAGSPELQRCTVSPYEDLLKYRLLRETPPCAALYPGGDPLYRAWNAQTGSVSFGYRPTIAAQELARQVVVQNYGRSARSYSLSTALRFAEDEGRGAALRVTPERLDLAAGEAQIVTLTLTLSPGALRDWTLNGGELGAQGSASCTSPRPEQDCPSLTLFEIDGALNIDGGANNRLSLPVHVLPRKVAGVAVSRTLAQQVALSNSSAATAGVVEPFALVDISPNKCDTREGRCATVDYTPGDVPGSAASPVDINYVGLRSYAGPGLNATLRLPAAPALALNDEVVEFAVTVHDKPYRASPNAPVQFEVHIDSDANGTIDYVAFNADMGDGRDGRSAVFVRDVNPLDGGRDTAPYFYTVADFNTQTWVLPVPAAAVGLRSDRAFKFYVRARDAYFREGDAVKPWDCSPGPLETCGAAVHTMMTGALRFRPSVESLLVEANGRAALRFTEDDQGASGSPSQIGLLLLYRDAMPGLEAEPVRLR